MLKIDPKIEVLKGDSEGDEGNHPCSLCRRKTRHLVLSDFKLSGTEETDDTFIYGWTNNYRIIQCQGCLSVQFFLEHTNSEEVMHIQGPHGYEEDYAVTFSYFPDDEDSREELDQVHLLPDSVERIYSETLRALNSNLAVLVGVGIRAFIETICNDKSANGNKLYEKISDLVNQGVLTQDGADILHKLRVLGNESAHEVKPNQKLTLVLAFDVVEHLLKGVYILPHLARKIK
ncbi:DUF4145 domain-containing protein [Marinimicrobium locisalis]|uniref:DUF4145 domain-containing protein n=1 Tax=Marinimicrobium locisalis TaxID=546022 RepID=UPI003221F92D